MSTDSVSAIRRFLLCLAACALMLAAVPLTAIAHAQNEAGSGDASCDGVIETADAQVVLEYLVGSRASGSCMPDGEPIDAQAADVDGDGFAALVDALAIAQRSDDGLDLRPEVVAAFPHDTTAFTQGLEFVDGELVESVGLFGQSDLRRVDPTSGQVLAQVATPDDLFAEGMTRVDDRLIQLTWRAGRAFVWDTASLEPIAEFTYAGEGWGLCFGRAEQGFDGDQLVMSDGSAHLRFRDPGTFLASREVVVTRNGEPVQRLNELECVGGVVWANVWQTDTIVRIDPASGEVTATVDLSTLLQPRPPGANVLNGIAFDHDTNTFWVTGKLWPTIFQVRFAAG